MVGLDDTQAAVEQGCHMQSTFPPAMPMPLVLPKATFTVTGTTGCQFSLTAGNKAAVQLTGKMGEGGRGGEEGCTSWMLYFP